MSGTRIRHQKLRRGQLDIRAFDAGEAASLAELESVEARTKIELPDIINVLIEELVRRRYELPALATLQRVATQARNDHNEAIYGTSRNCVRSGPRSVVRLRYCSSRRSCRKRLMTSLRSLSRRCASWSPTQRSDCKKYQLEHASMLDGLVGRFRDVLQILQDEGVPEPERLPKIREALGDPAEALAQC